MLEPIEVPSLSHTTAEVPLMATPKVVKNTIHTGDDTEEKATLKEILSILKSLLTSNIDRSDRLHAAVEALKQKPDALDTKTAFWNAYKPLGDDFDKEFKEKYGTNLDTSLIFAGLFSAVSSAFIIQIQPQLQVDPNMITQGLLLHLVQNITGSTPSGIQVHVPVRPDPMVIIAQSLLYFSLFSTLLAAVLAVLAKQWILHYDSAGERGSIEDRGLERQRKVDGLQRWRFDFVMQIFPLLLQTSLLLFAAALSIYLWTINHVIAGISMGLTSSGVTLYILMVVSALISRDSPYQTSLTAILASVIKFVAKFIKSTGDLKQKDQSASKSSNTSGETKHKKTCKALPPLLPLFNSEKPNTSTEKVAALFDELPGPSKEISAVLWALETSTDPRMVEVAAVMVLSLQWPVNLDLRPALRRLADVFRGCFTYSGSGKHVLGTGMNARATSCLKAFGVLERISAKSEAVVSMITFNPNLIENGDDELTSLVTLVKLFRVSEFNPLWDQDPNVTRWTLRFISAQHTEEYDIEKVLDCFKPNEESLKDYSLLADLLFCINSFFAPARQGLGLMDKSQYCEGIMDILFDNLANHLTVSSHPLDPQIAKKIFKRIGLFDHKLLNSVQWRNAAYKFCANPKLPWDIKALMLKLVRVSTGSIIPDKELVVDIEWVYTKLEGLLSPLTKDIELLCDLLQVLCHVQFVSTRSTIANTLISCISPVQHENNSMRRMQQLAFQILCSAVHWFQDNELQPVLQQQSVWEKLHNILMVSLNKDYILGYLELSDQISNIPSWHNIMRQKLPGWLQLMHSYLVEGHHLQSKFLLISVRLWDLDTREIFEFQRAEIFVVVAFTALANVWNQFDSSDPREFDRLVTLMRCTVSMAFLSRAWVTRREAGIRVIRPSEELKDKIMPRLSTALFSAIKKARGIPNDLKELKAAMNSAADVMQKVASTISYELTHGWIPVDRQEEEQSDELELRYWMNLQKGFNLDLSTLEELVEGIGGECVSE